MNKRELNRVFKQLNRVINLDNEVRAESSFFKYTPVHHSLNREIVEQLVNENPSWTEFDLFREVLEPVILQNPSNYSGLFAIYDLLARQASIDKNDKAYPLHQKAIHIAALRNLEGAKSSGAEEYFIRILGHHSCCNLCEGLHDKVYPEEEFLKNLPIPVQDCLRDDQLCGSLPQAIPKTYYSWLIEKGRLKS